jgi:hypothetical protein
LVRVLRLLATLTVCLLSLAVPRAVRAQNPAPTAPVPRVDSVRADTLHKPGVETVQDSLSAQGSEPKPLRWLRSYSNYLTPKTGLLSTDTLAGVATYLRNFILNITILISLLSVVLLVPRVTAWAGRFAEHDALVPLIIGLAALAVAIFFIDLNLANQLPESAFNRAEKLPGKHKLPWYSERSAVVVWIVVPLVVAGLSLSYWAVSEDSQLYSRSFSSGWCGALKLLIILLAATALVALFWVAALKIAKVIRHPGDRPGERRPADQRRGDRHHDPGDVLLDSAMAVDADA